MDFLRTKHNRVLLINIDNFSYDAALFFKNGGVGSPRVDFFSSGSITDVFTASESELKSQTERAFAKIFDKAAEVRGKIDFCLIILSAPWHISETHKVKITKKNPFIFTKKDFDKILKDEDSAFVKNIKTGFTRDFEFIEGNIMKSLMNGYETSSPFGKKAETVEMSIFISAFQKKFFDIINNSAGERLGCSFENGRLRIKTRQTVLFTALEQFFNFETGFIFLDIGSEISELTFVKNGIIEETAVFKKGRNFFVRRLMNRFNAEFHEAEDMLKRHNEGAAEISAADKTDSVLADAKKDWVSDFSGIIKDMASDHFLPRRLVVFAPNMNLDKIFTGKDGLKIDLFSEVNALSYKDFPLFSASFDRRELSTFLIFGAVYLNKEISEVAPPKFNYG